MKVPAPGRKRRLSRLALRRPAAVVGGCSWNRSDDRSVREQVIGRRGLEGSLQEEAIRGLPPRLSYLNKKARSWRDRACVKGFRPRGGVYSHEITEARSGVNRKLHHRAVNTFEDLFRIDQLKTDFSK